MATAQAVQSVTSVDVTQRCRDLAKPQPFPRDYAGKNVYVSRKQWIATAKIQREKLAYASVCITDTHDDYAKGLPTK